MSRAASQAEEKVEWLLTQAEVTAATPAFVWKYWTDVTHWVDPPATFRLEGPFEAGSQGVTLFPDREPFRWVLQEVVPGASYTIASELDGATVLFHWRFDPLPSGGTELIQRIGVSGKDAARHASNIRSAFEPSLAAGMKRIALLLRRAQGARAGGHTARSSSRCPSRSTRCLTGRFQPSGGELETRSELRWHYV